MKKSKALGILVLILAIMAGMSWYAGTIISTVGVGENRNIKLGLDLAGGVSITYGAVEDNPSEEDMKDTIYKLQKRVENYSTEASVYQEGGDRINIEIPGVSDANAILEELGKPGSMEFQNEAGETLVSGTDIQNAQAATYKNEVTGNTEYIVELVLTDEGAVKFEEATAANVGKTMPIVYDGETISAPQVKAAISGGRAQIDGMESFEAAENLASTIRIGSLSLELEELNSKVVGAQLGEEAISTSLKAAVIGLVLVMIFMIIVYLLPGFTASLALILYSALTIYALWIFDITLTLPGIAGIILSIGMAVDANVIIFARIREEIAAGKTVNSAIKLGYEKALSAIVDGNITTLIAAVVLGMRGSGPVKGFAYTLGIGIVLSMFTALVVTRWLMKCFFALGLQNAKFYGAAKQLNTIGFLKKKVIFFTISVIAIVAGFVGMGINGTNGNILNYSLDFVGGTSTTVTFNEDYSIAEIDDQIVPIIEQVTGDPNVQTQKIEGSNQVVIKTRSLELSERDDMNQALIEQFGVDEGGIIAENISSTISSEMRSDAVWAVVIATICMLIYIWFRFKDIRFAGSAVLALIHDVLVVLAFYAIARISVGNTFIACMLTIVGYSINATIVIFDRIRENLGGAKKKDPEAIEEIVNRSITQTLTRSINTSLTTFVMVFMLFILGVSSIREFALPLMAGIICGAYSSVCITGALWYVFKVKFVKK
ncbi:MAG: protein translocase subunit SecD [Lachnospiraceae bacterium]|jgi:SecD/SecF fusion protein|nr:protein translocase subunit SecD [Lachnospiraceae bacterium]